MKFLIEEQNGIIKHDFEFHLIQSIEFINWYCNEKKHTYCLTDNILIKDFSEYVPIGSIEFVLNFYKVYHNINNIIPINIPKELNEYKFLKRELYQKESLVDGDNYFYKSKNKFKDLCDIAQGRQIKQIENDILIYDLIEIETEYRCFIFNGKLLDIKNYGNRFDLLPNIKLIEDMIRQYKNSPKAYTIDVAILKNTYETALIEVHHFFSCGLYGFCDYNSLPKMFINTHNEIINNKEFN